ncbi:hypothetical protein CS022_20855 [Veronia nyctiphanis]|uniref:Uncharacterized protein n=1 Tax=Veronia nyctiphanis TaxID=1278244 RepID=A0A4Q0YL75_9GAMM|nr:hypothetical protein [Veronia nyctiphanis]RXJ71537.1 hypothetical protein CS022_20855 [Veronia nyctiphanis]
MSKDINNVTSLIKDTNSQIEREPKKFSKDVNIDTSKIISPEVVANTKFQLADIDSSEYKEKYQGAIALYNDKTNTVTLDKQRFGNLSPDERTSVLVHELSHAKEDTDSKSLSDTKKDTEASARAIETSTLAAINLANNTNLKLLHILLMPIKMTTFTQLVLINGRHLSMLENTASNHTMSDTLTLRKRRMLFERTIRTGHLGRMCQIFLIRASAQIGLFPMS